MYREIGSVPELKERWESEGSLRRVVCRDLDLTGETGFLRQVSADGAVFLGCAIEGSAMERIVATGGVVFPRIELLLDLPFETYRDGLYTLPELMRGLDTGRPGSFFADTVDGKIYRRFQKYRRDDEEPIPILEALARRLHDHAIDDAQYEFLRDRPDVVGIMGGHRLRRGVPTYRDVAWLARTLARKGILVVTGGGPGAMEAGNLGAWLADLEDGALDEAIELLNPSPDFGEDPERYLEHGYRVLERFSDDPRSPNGEHGTESLAVPTWFYGHEPTNQFATHIAKYFANSVREDGLVTIATRGIVFAPGSAGTVQEIFMDATQNHYGTQRMISPMVLLGHEHWTETIPVTPVLDALADERPMAGLLTVEDTPERVVEFLESTAPVASPRGVVH